MRKSHSYSVSGAALQCVFLAGLVVIVLNPKTLRAQAPTSASDQATSFTFTEIKFPGAIRTRALALNDHREIVGNYFDSNSIFHGYVWKRGTFASFDPPNSTRTEANGINNAGVISGYFADSNNLVHGYLLYRSIFTIFDFPGATATFAGHINERLQVVGIYLDSGSNEHGFLLSIALLRPLTFQEVSQARKL